MIVINDNRMAMGSATLHMRMIIGQIVMRVRYLFAAFLWPEGNPENHADACK